MLFQTQASVVNYLKRQTEQRFFPKFIEISLGVAAWHGAMQAPYANYLKFFDQQKWQMRLDNYEKTQKFELLTLEELQVFYTWIETLKPFYLLTSDVNQICEELLDYKAELKRSYAGINLSQINQSVDELIVWLKSASSVATNYLINVENKLQDLAKYFIKHEASYQDQLNALFGTPLLINFIEQSVQYYADTSKAHPLLTLLNANVPTFVGKHVTCSI